MNHTTNPTGGAQSNSASAESYPSLSEIIGLSNSINVRIYLSTRLLLSCLSLCVGCAPFKRKPRVYHPFPVANPFDSFKPYVYRAYPTLANDRPLPANQVAQLKCSNSISFGKHKIVLVSIDGKGFPPNADGYYPTRFELLPGRHRLSFNPPFAVVLESGSATYTMNFEAGKRYIAKGYYEWEGHRGRYWVTITEEVVGK